MLQTPRNPDNSHKVFWNRSSRLRANSSEKLTAVGRDQKAFKSAIRTWEIGNQQQTTTNTTSLCVFPCIYIWLKCKLFFIYLFMYWFIYLFILKNKLICSINVIFTHLWKFLLLQNSGPEAQMDHWRHRTRSILLHQSEPMNNEDLCINLLLKQFIECWCKLHTHARCSSHVHDPLMAHFQSLLMRVGTPRAFMHSIGTEIEYT